MKSPSNLVLLIALSASLAGSESIQRITLDDHVVLNVPVGTNRVTTISFPGPVTAIDGAGVTTDSKLPGDFLLAHTKGSSFLSIRALTRKASANLNIRWSKRTYVFEFFESSTPVLALNLEERRSATKVKTAPVVSPIRLLSLLDKAKSYPLLKQQHPESVAYVEVKTFPDKPEITDFNEFEIRITEIFRFDPEDTLVFQITLRNKSNKDIRYRPETFAVRAGNRLYHQSISDASGMLPAKSEATVYFAITGTPDGGRNELSLKNQFSVFVTRLEEPPSSPQGDLDLFPILPLEDEP
jgi:hypothetical protein